MKTVVALYDRVEDAKRVISALTDAGVSANNINMVAGDPENQHGAQLAPVENEEAKAAADGAVAGGLIGGVVGVLLGVGAFVVPGLGPIVAAGPLASGLIGAAVGAASGGLVGALVEWGIGEDEAGYYLEGVRRGGTLVAVRAEEEQAEAVARLMNDAGLVDLETRVAKWRDGGWSGYTGEYDDVDFDVAGNAFREHYDETFADTDTPYDEYAPVYRFGYFAASDDRFINQPWEDAAPAVKDAWRAEYGDEDWEQYEDAVRFAYHQAQTYML